ncbi:MAG: lipopolysaccharide kinase InaA family protein [Phycisphaerales bacterium]
MPTPTPPQLHRTAPREARGNPAATVAPAARSLRILRCTVADPARIVGEAASTAWLQRATVLKSEGRSAAYAGRVDALPVVVKCLRLDRPKDLLARAFGQTRGLRQWSGAALLASRGFATPELLVLARGRDESGRVVETLVMERVDAPTLLQVIAERAGGRPSESLANRALAREAGALAGRMARAGLRNRDLKPSNVLAARKAGGSEWLLIQIDTVGVREDDAASAGEMLFRLLVECVGVGRTPARTLRWRAVRAALETGGGAPSRGTAKALWREVEARLARHGDPTPKVNPLSSS